MGVQEGRVDSNVPTGYGYNGSGLGFIMVVASRRDYYLFSNLPIDILANAKYRAIGTYGGGKSGPDGSRFAIHRKFALQAEDHLVAADGLLSVVVSTGKDEGEAAVQRLLLSACDEPSSHYRDKGSCYSDRCVIREDDCAVLDCDSRQVGGALVNQQGHACWHEDQIVIDRRQINTPSPVVAPFQHVQKLGLQYSVVAIEGH